MLPTRSVDATPDSPQRTIVMKCIRARSLVTSSPAPTKRSMTRIAARSGTANTDNPGALSLRKRP